ncbi:MAG: HNH endonuclease [Chlamydiia bacterium]|nr:HNH endonuclease [Chlamydiia bacterium]
MEWNGTITKEGYGRFKFQGKVYSAHKQHWAMRLGEIPEGMIVCHHCDNRACVKIGHLFLASSSHNSKDMVRKNRQAKGSKNGSSKLNETHIRDTCRSSYHKHFRYIPVPPQRHPRKSN